MTALLEARGVVKRFGGLTAVDRVDISVGAGEMVGLIGPNGSGKTTLFDCLSRVSSLDSGSVRFDGVDITRHRPHQVARLGLARTFQLIRVYRELTVSENMELSIQWARVGVARLFGSTDPATRRRGRVPAGVPADSPLSGTNAPAPYRAASAASWRSGWP